MPVADPQNYSRCLEAALDKIYGDEEREILGLQKEADFDHIGD